MCGSVLHALITNHLSQRWIENMTAILQDLGLKRVSEVHNYGLEIVSENPRETIPTEEQVALREAYLLDGSVP